MMKHSHNKFVLIRGLLRESRHWGEFSNILQQYFPDAEIHTPDIPGNGRLHDHTSPNTIAGLTDALRQQIPVRHKLNLIAVSMGGMIAIDWMNRYPDEISSAVLINTSVRPCSPFYQRLRWQLYPAIMKMLFHSRHQRELDILKLISNRHQQDSELIKSWQQWQQQYPITATSAKNQLLAAAKFSITSQHPNPPILIVASKADRLVNYRCSLTLQQIWQTDYQQHDTAGHDIPLDEPIWLINVISQWLGSL